jgi:hypothetical protein
LPESHLLTSLGGDGLQEQLSSGTRVEGGEETVNSRLSKSSEDGAELDELGDGVEVVGVRALLGTCRGSYCDQNRVEGRGAKGSQLTSTLQNVRDQVGVSDLLLGHEADELSLLGVNTLGVELGVREPGETVVEEVELDPLLVQGQVETLEVKVGHGLVLCASDKRPVSILCT